MTLEFKASFDEKSWAVEFQKFLETLLVPSKIEKTYDHHAEYNLRGTYPAMQKLIADVRKDLSDKDIFRSVTERRADKTEGEITDKRNAITRIYAKYPVGTAFTCSHEDGSDDSDDDIEEEVLGILYRNGTADYNEDSKKWTLLEKKDVDDIVDDFLNDGLTSKNMDELKSYGIVKVMDYFGKLSYTVVSSPVIVFANLDKIKEYFEEKGFEASFGEDEEFEMMYTLKSLVLRVIRLIRSGVSKDNLWKELAAPGPCDGMPDCAYLFRVNIESEDFIDDVLEDLKNVGIISNKNGKLEVTKKFDALISEMK